MTKAERTELARMANAGALSPYSVLGTLISSGDNGDMMAITERLNASVLREMGRLSGFDGTTRLAWMSIVRRYINTLLHNSRQP